MIIQIQYLRGIAALMVAVFHAFELIERQSGIANPFKVGALGVDIFFVVSGFIIFVAAEKSEPRPGDFMLRRILRIVPLYWALTLFISALALVRPELLASTVFDPVHLLASLFFVPMAHPKLGELFPVLVPGWTLNYEMAFYLVMAGALWAPRARRPWIVLALLVSLVALHSFGAPIPAFYGNSIILEFGLGLLIAMAYRTGWRIDDGIGTIVTLAGFAALVWLEPLDLPRIVKAGLPAALIVGGAALALRPAARVPQPLLLLLGDASYSLYLTQAIVLPAVAKAWGAAGLSLAIGGGLPFAVAASAVAALSGIACYMILEKPLLGLSTRLPRRPRPSVNTW
ncbi:acyltransferase family protein [Aureimonas ureilytica]|uniref:acyltransferase family protein n=1 Tax=Aureimonas ureilytica TaxID=401562 RepID=UPI003CFB85C5